MAKSNKSYKDKLERGYELYNSIKNMLSFLPAEEDLEPGKYLTFLNSITNINHSADSIKEKHGLSIKARQELFLKDKGVKRRASYIFAYCKSRSDLKLQTEMIGRLSKSILNYKKSDTPVKGKSVKHINRKEQSFGDYVSLFEDLIDEVRLIPSYTPPNELIQISTLVSFRKEMLESNKTVDDKLNSYNTINKKRLESYNMLHDRMVRIKSSVKSQYGINSSEYQSIKGIRVN
ncbi:MAG: hypothetical protein WC644_07900 [Ignavibacteria bacterium]